MAILPDGREEFWKNWDTDVPGLGIPLPTHLSRNYYDPELNVEKGKF